MVSAAAPRFRLAFVGFGEAAFSIASGLREAGFDGMAAFDVAADREPFRTRIRERAELAGVTLLDGPEGLSGAETVFVLVQPSASMAVAQSCASHVSPDALYVDLTSLGPTDKAAVGAYVAAAGRRFVDAAILGSAPTSRNRVPIVAAGPEVNQFVERFAPYGMDISPVGERFGAAAGLKIVRSVLAKGLEALYVEALIAARRMGVEAEVLQSFCAFLDARPALDTAAMLVRSHVPHAGRRADEMRMSRAAVAETGLDPLMTDAIVQLMERSAASGVVAAGGGSQPPSLDAALTILDAALAAAPRPAKS
jgi:3-hydroxyisobutyrate dehydrogenase-like beta-hydroxyacid dehydrogenase